MIKQEVSGTMFAPPYECIFMDRVEKEFIAKKHLKPWISLRHIDGKFFVWTHGKHKLYKFLECLTVWTVAFNLHRSFLGKK